MTRTRNALGARESFALADGGEAFYYRLSKLEEDGLTTLSRLPFSIRVLLEAALRKHDGYLVRDEDVKTLAGWTPKGEACEIPFMPARVILQDFTGVPAVVDLAALRNAMVELGGDPKKVNPLVPVDLVIDHSVQVDFSGRFEDARARNLEIEYQRNKERYEFLKWGQKNLDNFRAVPPGRGIVHQVNLEWIAQVAHIGQEDGKPLYYCDTVVGTDSHTTMINGLGVLGWGVGGIEAEAVMLGQPVYMLTPEVVGFRLTGKLKPGVTATDMTLRIVEMLRKKGVVEKFVEFYGEGVGQMPLADRAMVANMAPEYGATCGFFPVDHATLEYMRQSGRDEAHIQNVERYYKAQGLFRTEETPDPEFTDTLHLDLSEVEPALAGPKRPQDRVNLSDMKEAFQASLTAPSGHKGHGLPASKVGANADVKVKGGQDYTIRHGDVVIAAITSCTNTSNPSVMLAAGLVARKARERGLMIKPWVKPSLAPGSRVVTEYYKAAGLDADLDALGFHVVGYGCTTCIAEGTPVLMGDGLARPIEDLPDGGGSVVFGPDAATRRLGLALQTEAFSKGEARCVELILQDGRALTCTPDHQVLRSDGIFVRADALKPGVDRVLVGPDAPCDVRGEDERGYVLEAGELAFRLDEAHERRSALAFVRLLGFLMGDGSISEMGQGRISVGQAMDREVILNDIELVTGQRPSAGMYDDIKWSVILPKSLTQAFLALDGVESGRRIHQPASLPAFITDPGCPVSLVREFLAGHFGADGWAPGANRATGCLVQPALMHAALTEHVPQMKAQMEVISSLLARCGVDMSASAVLEYPVRHAESSWRAKDDKARVEVRLTVPDGLGFVERVGYRYCIQKSMVAAAACVHWRTVKNIGRQRLQVADAIRAAHANDPSLSFERARSTVAEDFARREVVLFEHYVLLEGYDRYGRLPASVDFKPLHRESAGFPSLSEEMTQIGAGDWLSTEDSPRDRPRYICYKGDTTVPMLSLAVLGVREAGQRPVYDLSVAGAQAFVAGGVCVHNCIGNSGPLDPNIEEAIAEADLIVASVLSGNRNFEGRVHQNVQANFLASPPLVVAYALAGTVDIDLTTEPIDKGKDGQDVYLKDIWPSDAEIRETMQRCITPQMFRDRYADATEEPRWDAIDAVESDLYPWSAESTYIQLPSFFEGLAPEVSPIESIQGARVLLKLGDSVTTDHISPAGAFPTEGPAGQYLVERGVEPWDFNSFGSRRGNHEVMMRGTFANVRIRNQIAPGTEGGYSKHQPSGEVGFVYDVAMRYKKEGTPLIVLAGSQYGTGSSRDWAAKGVFLLGVKAVIATSFERIHRSNLVGMGVLPLCFLDGQSAATLGLDGSEVFDFPGLTDAVKPLQTLEVVARRADGAAVTFEVTVRLDTPVEVDYYRNGGILQTVVRNLALT